MIFVAQRDLSGGEPNRLFITTRVRRERKLNKIRYALESRPPS